MLLARALAFVDVFHLDFIVPTVTWWGLAASSFRARNFAT